MDFLSLLLVNANGKVSRVVRNGRVYHVAPVTLIVPGVLPGSEGPLAYTDDDTAEGANDWNDIPMVVYHPTVNGQFVSARHPQVLDSSKIGRIYEAVFNGKLQAQAWFDEEHTKRVDATLPDHVRILPRLLAGQPIEMSTGLRTVKEAAPPGSVFNGVAFTHYARKHKPDHVAVLPDQKGACPVERGCGINNADSTTTTIGDLPMDRAATIAFITANCDCWKGVPEATETLNKMTDVQLTKIKQGVEKTKTLELAANTLTTVAKEFGVPSTMTFNEMPAFIKEKAGKGKTKEEEEEEAKKKGAPVANATLADWMKTAPPEVSSVVNSLLTMEAEQKVLIVNRMTGHLPEGAPKEQVKQMLTAKPLAELKLLASIQPQQQTTVNSQAGGLDLNSLALYFGAGAGNQPVAGQPILGVFNGTQPQDDPNDVLPTPVYDWQSIANSQRTRDAASVA